jgi:ribosomal protein L7Ae-like RNA K-turn-binding protein
MSLRLKSHNNHILVYLLVKLQKQKKFAGLLGIAKKAGRVIAGTNLVTDSIRSGSVSKCPHAVFLASDVSENTRKRITNCCTYYEVSLYNIPMTIAEIGDAIGKSGSVSAVGITDAGLCDALVKLI